MWGDAEWVRRDQERQARADQVDAEQWEEGSQLEVLLQAAETDQEAGRVIALARLLDSQSFAMRDQGLAFVEAERRGRRGNDPAHQRVIRVHERVARLHIAAAVRKARAILALVQSWSAEG
jgi:hypothetical protein